MAADGTTTPAYDVHLYCLVRVKRCGVASRSPERAMAFALARTDLYGLFERLDTSTESMEVEYAEEILGCLVDEVGDDGHERSRYFCQHGKPAAFGRDCECETGVADALGLQPIYQILSRLLTRAAGYAGPRLGPDSGRQKAHLEKE